MGSERKGEQTVLSSSRLSCDSAGPGLEDLLFIYFLTRSLKSGFYVKFL